MHRQIKISILNLNLDLNEPMRNGLILYTDQAVK